MSDISTDTPPRNNVQIMEARLSARPRLAADAGIDRSEAAPQFLQKLWPGGPWVLTAIIPDGPTTTITARSEDDVPAFVREHDGKRNIYYTVNPTKRAMSKKPTKGDIAAIEYLIADLDPRDGEATNVAKARYLAALAEHNPEPAAVIDSGNGIQALFKLRERIVIEDEPTRDEEGKLIFSARDQAKVDDVEARSKALMISLGAKAGTQNIDRILRLPGTTNLPNKKKRENGRVPCPAWLISFDGAAYELEDFPLEPKETAGAELPETLRALLHIPDDGTFAGYPRRSELLFAFLCEAIRAGVADEVIIDACLDNKYAGCAIREHIRENGGRAGAVRQLARAKAKVRENKTQMHTDLGNARRLVRMFGKDLRYVHAWRSWLVWKDGHWRRDEDQGIMRQAKAAVEAMFAEAAQINDENRRTAQRVWALKSQEAKRLAAMVNLAQSEIEVVLSVKEIDADPYLLGVHNGVIDLRTGAFREVRRDDYVTKTAGTAFDSRARCPNWELFLKKVLPDEVVKYLQRATGYVLTGLTVEEVLFVLWGTGANGKSTFRETLFALLGDYAVGADASLLVTPKQGGGATPDLARLHGRRLVTVNETEQNDKLNESRVKFITGHDTITARNLYEAPFDFPPTHKAFLTTNHKPIVRGADEGIWRRIHLLPFIRKIPVEERDVHFRQKKLLPEVPGILNWALDGLKTYQRDGLNPPETVRAATKEYREDMDIIGQWIEERCELDLVAVTTIARLHHDYNDWAEDAAFLMSAIKFARALADRGFERTRVAGGAKAFRGVKLKKQ